MYLSVVQRDVPPGGRVGTKATGVSSGSFKTRKLPDFAVVTPIEYGTGNSIRVAFDKYNE